MHSHLVELGDVGYKTYLKDGSTTLSTDNLFHLVKFTIILLLYVTYIVISPVLLYAF